MKQEKFAPITAALLARKGEARPWAHADSMSGRSPEPVIGFFSRRPPVFGQAVKEQANDPAPSPPALAFPQCQDGIRKLTLRVSQVDYERLGLVAAKRDISRQRLLHQMLDQFLANAADEYGATCGCIGGTCQRHD
jgi:hypothetical protein